MSHLFAYLFRMRFIRRWGLMHTTYPENVQEHSLRVAMIAHALALVRKRVFGGDADENRVAAAALFHDAAEVLIGDLPAPVKYFNPKIRDAYKELEATAAAKLQSMVPAELVEEYAALLGGPAEEPTATLVKAADRLAAYLKCLEELQAGNREFVRAAITLRRQLHELELAEVEWFLERFAASFEKTLDELE